MTKADAHYQSAHRCVPRPTLGRGFTVVELLLATTLMAILMTAIGFALTTMISHVNITDGSIQVRQTSQIVLDQINTKIRRAKLVQLKLMQPNSDGAATDDYSRIEILDSGTWDSATNSYANQKWTVFAVSNGQLIVGQGATSTPATMHTVLTGVSDMVFHGAADAHGVIRDVNIELTLVKDNIKPSTSTSYSLASSATIRALR